MATQALLYAQALNGRLLNATDAILKLSNASYVRLWKQADCCALQIELSRTKLFTLLCIDTRALYFRFTMLRRLWFLLSLTSALQHNINVCTSPCFTSTSLTCGLRRPAGPTSRDAVRSCSEDCADLLHFRSVARAPLLSR